MEKVTIGNAELWHGDCLEIMEELSGIEIDRTYFERAYIRIEQEQKQGRLFDNHKESA